MRMNKNTKIITGSVVALAVIVVLGLVYAAFTQQLTINGTATGRSSSWKIYFSRLTSPTLNGTAKELTAPTIKNNSTTIGDYSVSVTSPGDYIEYEFDVTNDGDYDATLTGLTKNSNTGLTYTGSGDNKSNDEVNVMNQIEYTLKYTDGTNVSENDTLKSKETKTMLLRLTYKTFSDASLLPQHDVAISGLGISITYTQDGNAKVNPDGSTPLITYDYHVGDRIQVAGDTTGDYYRVITDSPDTDDYVVALKENPLIKADINTYGGVGTENNHVNQYTIYSYQGTACQKGPYGGMAYYTSETCGYNGSGWVSSGCTTAYNSSEVKYVVDAWATSKFSDQLKTVDGYSVRLITHEELVNYLDCTPFDCTKSKYQWVHNTSYPYYWYWTMSQYNDSSSIVWVVEANGHLNPFDVDVRDYDKVVRPVINVYKSAIQNAS